LRITALDTDSFVFDVSIPMTTPQGKRIKAVVAELTGIVTVKV
jgi:hypothetical protein